MTRIVLPEPPYPPHLSEDLQKIMPPGQNPFALFRAVGRSPRHWRKFIAASLHDRGPISLRERELVILRVAANRRCDYDWGVHTSLFAERCGFARQELDAIALVSDVPIALNLREQTIVAAVDGLCQRDGAWTDQEFGRFERELTLDVLYEVIALVGFYSTVSLWCQALSLDMEPGSERIPRTA